MFQKILNKFGYRKIATSKWRILPTEVEGMIEIQCVNCEARKLYCLRETDLFKYCPCCGAEMKGEVEDV